MKLKTTKHYLSHCTEKTQTNFLANPIHALKYLPWSKTAAFKVLGLYTLQGSQRAFVCVGYIFIYCVQN